MTLTPGWPDRRTSLAWVRPAAGVLTIFVCALLADRWLFHHFVSPDIYGKGWARMLRSAGYFPLWALVAFALFLQDWAPRSLHTLQASARRGLLLFWSTALSGMAAELLKIVIRRERPGPNDGDWVFRAWSDRPFSTGQLGLPSSEAAVAFAAAAMLARLFPRTGGLWYTIGFGCALMRVAAGAHFLSDVALAALVGYLVSAMLWQRAGPTALQAAAPTQGIGLRS